MDLKMWVDGIGGESGGGSGSDGAPSPEKEDELSALKKRIEELEARIITLEKKLEPKHKLNQPSPYDLSRRPKTP